MGIALLAVALLACLLIIPVGLPGTWGMIVAAALYAWLATAAHLGGMIILLAVGIALVAEVLDFAVSARYTRKYGGSKRGAWGALIGGLVGAIVGVPVPIIGSVIGAMVGAFAGALIFEYTTGASHGTAAKAATGAAIGRAVAMALKVAAGCVIAAILLSAAIL